MLPSWITTSNAALVAPLIVLFHPDHPFANPEAHAKKHRLPYLSAPLDLVVILVYVPCLLCPVYHDGRVARECEINSKKMYSKFWVIEKKSRSEMQAPVKILSKVCSNDHSHTSLECFLCLKMMPRRHIRENVHFDLDY